MAAIGEMPIAASGLSPLANINVPFDPEMETFINYDQPVYSSPSLSSSSSEAKSSISQPLSSQNITNPSSINSSTPNAFASNNHASQAQQQQQYAAPSHQYGSYQQQTGLPMGGLANTIAINNAHGMQFGYGDGSFNAPTDGFHNRARQEDGYMEYIPRPMQSLPLKDPSDMDLDGEPAADGTQNFLNPSQVFKTQFVDPNALGGHEMSPVVPSNQIGRVYPGIHQQQAARAKAVQQQQRQQELLRRQQQQQQSQTQQQQPQTPASQPQHQQQSPVETESEKQANRPQNKQNKPTDPVVQERISRLLQQMRQSSVSGSPDSPSPSNMPQPTKLRKDEQDMDEDERLLASEEGKKLSSKERRQLRNKVSARAFRSRRKEYIGQLEGEVATKANEANDLRLQNRALIEENTRLTDLTRLLLSSSHFASFLNDISATGVPAALAQAQTSIPQVSSQPSQPKEETPNPPSTQDVPLENPQTALPTIPEQGFDYSTMDMNDQGWNSGIDFNFANPTVFAVVDVPEMPAIDTEIFTGKSSNWVGPLPCDDGKDVIPSIEHAPMPVETTQPPEPQQTDPEMQLDENDPAFALFVDQPSTSRSAKSPDPVENPFGDIEFENMFAKYDLVVEQEGTGSNGSAAGVSAAAFRQFEILRARIEGPFQRVLAATSHLD